MFEKKDEAAKKAAEEKAAKDKAAKEEAKQLAKENADLKKRLAKLEGDDAKKAADDGKPKDQASQEIKPVPQADAEGDKPDTVITGKLESGERFYGEDFGDGKLVDRYTGKQVVQGSVEKTIKVVDPKNPNVMRPKKIIVPVYRLK